MQGAYHQLFVNLSLVTAKEPCWNGCPKAADVPKLMSDIITIETYKTRTDLNFHIQTVKKLLYPVQRENGPYIFVMLHRSGDDQSSRTH